MTAVRCKRCGTEAPEEGTNNCKSCGSFLPANTAAVNVGHRGVQFWQQRSGLVADLREEIAADLGYDAYASAPVAARGAIDGLLQAVVVRGAAHQRVLSEGGPLAASNRARRAAKVALEWDKRAEAWTRLLGLRRVPKPTASLAEYMRGKADGEAS